jgi:hypothetical protein
VFGLTDVVPYRLAENAKWNASGSDLDGRLGENIAPESGECSGYDDDDDVIGSGESTGMTHRNHPPCLFLKSPTTRVRTGENSSENDSNREVDASDGGLSRSRHSCCSWTP